jgi:uncharacterized protein
MRENVDELTIPLEDGRVALAADLMYPGQPVGPYPVLISMYPYHKDDVIGSTFEALRRLLASSGYATLLVDMRGHGGSSGSPAAAYDLGGVEGADGEAVVEWAAAQKWCNGSVGMWGVSYGAMVAIATAARRPPHLRAIVAVYGTDDCLSDSIAPGGSPYALGRYSWVAHMLAMDLCPPTRQDDGGRWRQVWAEHLARMRTSPGHAFEWQPHIDDAPFWASRLAHASRIEVPAFLIGGWYDLYADSMVRIFKAISAERRLVIGPWPHVFPDRAEREPFDWVAQMCRWWDRYLPAASGAPADQGTSGRPPPPVTEPNVLLYVNGAARWRAYADWPPPTESLVLFLGSNGHLELSPGDAGTEAAFQSGDLTGRTAGLLDPLGTGLGLPEDQHDDDMASLAFETESLTADLALAGRPHLDLTVPLAPAMDLRLVARICDVSPDGRSTLLTSGWARVLRSPEDKNEMAVEVRCAPVAAVVLAGHRLRVSLSSSDFPRMWPTAGGDFSVVVGGPLASRIALPRPGGPENREGWDHDGGEDWTDRVPRPVSATTPAWSVSGSAGLRQIREVPGPIIETDIETRSELRTPRGATIWVNERFRAAASALKPQDARVHGDVRFVIELADGSKVDVAVESAFSERTSRAKAQVTFDGRLVLDEVWQSPGLVEDNSGAMPNT